MVFVLDDEQQEEIRTIATEGVTDEKDFEIIERYLDSFLGLDQDLINKIETPLKHFIYSIEQYNETKFLDEDKELLLTSPFDLNIKKEKLIDLIEQRYQITKSTIESRKDGLERQQIALAQINYLKEVQKTFYLPLHALKAVINCYKKIKEDYDQKNEIIYENENKIKELNKNASNKMVKKLQAELGKNLQTNNDLKIKNKKLESQMKDYQERNHLLEGEQTKIEIKTKKTQDQKLKELESYYKKLIRQKDNQWKEMTKQLKFAQSKTISEMKKQHLLSLKEVGVGLKNGSASQTNPAGGNSK